MKKHVSFLFRSNDTTEIRVFFKIRKSSLFLSKAYRLHLEIEAHKNNVAKYILYHQFFHIDICVID